MRADLSPQDREGFLHFGYEQTQWASLSEKNEQDNGDGWTDFVILGTVALIVFIAALIGIYGPGMAALARSVL